MDRRGFLSAASGAIAAALLPRARAAEATLAVTALTPGVSVITGAGANVTVAAAANEVLLVDGGHETHAAQLLRLVEQRWPGRKIAALFNTNWRPEHTGANAAVKTAGARVLAHENTKLWLAGDFRVAWEGRDYSPRPAAMLPTDTFYTAGSVPFGAAAAHYGYLRGAHTDGDIYVHFPDENVLVASQALAVGRYPLLDYSTGGWIGGLERATRELLALADDATQIVPAHGAAQRKSALQAQLALCTAMRERVALAFRNGMSLADFAASAPTKEFDAERGDPTQFVTLVYKGAYAHIRELGGVI